MLDIDDFSKLFNEHLDILEIFEKVFSTSRWKLSNYDEQNNNDQSE